MLTSAPFDDWWHSAYGLDVKIRSAAPRSAHLRLHHGRSRRPATRPRRNEPRHPRHPASPQIILSLIARSSGHRWGATIGASVYTIFMLGFEWILPLFAAEPKLGPAYVSVAFFVPPQFPLLLVVPAIACDLIWQRLSARTLWTQALASGLAFVAVFMAVQWPFATFLMSDGAKNWFFGAHYFGYFTHPNCFLRRGLFFTPENEKTLLGFATVLAQAAVASILMIRFGFGLGNWMRAVRR